MTPTFDSRLDFSALQAAVGRIRQAMHQLIVGQDAMIDLLMAALLSNGHVLIEGVPGVAKTLAAKLLAQSIEAGFSRIQFTPDLMPADVLGTSIFNPKDAAFTFHAGPVFSNLVLIDEINRAPAKTQSALFEVMEERQVTVDGTTYLMAAPFMVLATQNPIEHEGTYRLPEAQLDRFLFKIEVDYPSLEEETQILTDHHQRRNRLDLSLVTPQVTGHDIPAFQALVGAVHIDLPLMQYIAQIVHQTRNTPALYLGGSPRASLALMTAAKAIAAMNGRDFVTPEDIRDVTAPVLHHRVLLTPEKEMEGIRPADIIRQLVQTVEVPR